MNGKKVLWSTAVVALVFSGSAGAAGLTRLQQLGKSMYQDKDFSFNGTQSCLSCHHRISGFADPANMRDPEQSVVSTGADGSSTGGRNAPSAAYAGFSPVLEKTPDGYRGGLFWDGRASGLTAPLHDPLAEQAQGPPLNPVEMASTVETVVNAIQQASYVTLYNKVFPEDTFDDPAETFDNVARALAAYERSGEVQAFSSRYDSGSLDAQELIGQELFTQHCARCHSLSEVDGQGPVFTNYGYYNIGLPTQPLLASAGPDSGLGGYLASDSVPPDFAPDAAAEWGKFKVPTLRNVALTAPYGHNGYFPTLKDILSFKNDRGLWPQPEIEENLYNAEGQPGELGALELDEIQLQAVEAFLRTLTDR